MKDPKSYFIKKKYSQNGQDAFLIEYFNNKKNGVFIEIGANNGISFSNTFYLEKELNWTGICIEPIPISYNKLIKNRSSINILAGVSDVESVETFLYIEPSAYTLSGMVKEYSPKHLARVKKQAKDSGAKLIEIDIPCVILNNVLIEYNIIQIDYLSIDTEGNELKILKSIDFSKFDIELISAENNFNSDEPINFMNSVGYKHIGKIGADDFFSKIR